MSIFRDDEEKPQKLSDLTKTALKPADPQTPSGVFQGPDLSGALAPGDYTKEEWDLVKGMRLEPKRELDLSEEIAHSLARGAVGVAKTVPEMVEFVGGDVLGSKTVKDLTRPVIKGMEEFSEEKLGASPGIKDLDVSDIRWWASKVPEAAASIAGFMAGGAAGKGLALVGRYGKLIKAAEAAGDFEEVARLANTVAKIGQWSGYGTGMAMEAAGARERQRAWEEEHPGQEMGWGTKVLTTLGTGIAAGSLEALSIERMFHGKAGKLLANKIFDSLAVEGGTEGAQELIANAFEKVGYNPKQELTEGVLEAMIVGAAVGSGGGLIAKAGEYKDAWKERSAYKEDVRATRAEDYIAGESDMAAQEAAARRNAFMPGMPGVAPAAPVDGPMGTPGDETTPGAPPTGPDVPPTMDGGPGAAPTEPVGPAPASPMGSPGDETVDLSQSPYYKGEGPDVEVPPASPIPGTGPIPPGGDIPGASPIPPASPVPPASPIAPAGGGVAAEEDAQPGAIQPIVGPQDFQDVFGQNINEDGVKRLLSHAGVDPAWIEAVTPLVMRTKDHQYLTDLFVDMGMDQEQARAVADGFIQWQKGPFDFNQWLNQQYGGQEGEGETPVGATTEPAPQGAAGPTGEAISPETPVSPSGETDKFGEARNEFLQAVDKIRRETPDGTEAFTRMGQVATEIADKYGIDPMQLMAEAHDKVISPEGGGNIMPGVKRVPPPPRSSGAPSAEGGSPSGETPPTGENIVPGVKRVPPAPRTNVEPSAEGGDQQQGQTADQDAEINKPDNERIKDAFNNKDAGLIDDLLGIPEGGYKGIVLRNGDYQTGRLNKPAADRIEQKAKELGLVKRGHTEYSNGDRTIVFGKPVEVKQPAGSAAPPTGITGKKPEDRTGTRTGPTPTADALAKEKEREAKKKVEEKSESADNTSEADSDDAIINSSSSSARDGEASEGRDDTTAKDGDGQDQGGQDKESASSSDPWENLLRTAIDEGRAVKNPEIKKLAQDLGLDLEQNAKEIDEALEVALVKIARERIVAMRKAGMNVAEIFEEMRRIYSNQPNLSSRTSTSIKNQAYSTPLPLAFLMNEVLGIGENTWVYEPTAGNGMLLIGSNPGRTHANELENNRVVNLRQQNFRTVTQEDATQITDKPNFPTGQFNVVVMNPPFGSMDKVKYDGYVIKKLEHLIALKSLEAMADDGRAAIIIGGHSFRTAFGKEQDQLTDTDWVFFNYLYSHYNVTHHINIDGSVYRRMGTSFPIRLLVVEGRKAEVSDKEAAPKRSDIQEASNFSEVYDILKQDINDAREKFADGRVATGLSEGQRGSPEGPGAPGSEEKSQGGDESGDVSEPVGNQGALPPAIVPGGRVGTGGGGRPSADGSTGDIPGGTQSSGGKSGVGGTSKPKSDGSSGDGGVSGKSGQGNEGGSSGGSGGGRGGTSKSGGGKKGTGGTDATGDDKSSGKPKRPGKTPLTEEEKATKRMLKEILKDFEKWFKAQTDSKHLADMLRKHPELREAFLEMQRRHANGETVGDTKEQQDTFKNPDFWEKAKKAFEEAFGKDWDKQQTSQEDKEHWDKVFDDLKTEREERQKEERSKKDSPKETDLQTHYKPKSKGNSFNSVAPNRVATGMSNAVARLEERHGPVDLYVLKKLQYSSPEEMFSCLGAEQIESIALAIDQIDNGGGFIIGHETGFGKGRINAGVLRYARLQGKKPIFFTSKAHLFSAMYDDLKQIGTEFNPLVIASANDANIYDIDGNIIKKLNRGALTRSALQDMITNRAIPDEYDGVFISYSQINGNCIDMIGGAPVIQDYKMTPKQALIARLAQNNIVVLDEAHNAAGDASNTMIYVSQAIVGGAQGVLYSSATFAKRPSSMPLYWRAMSRIAGGNHTRMIENVQRMGVTGQEWLTSALADEGLYTRGEQSYDGIETSLVVDQNNSERDRARADSVTSVLRDVVRFDGYITEIVDEIRGQMNPGGRSGGTTGRASTTVTHTEFSAVVHNIINQFLFCTRAQAAVDSTVKQLQEGVKGHKRKSFIAVYNTMDAIVKDLIANGDAALDEPFHHDFRAVLRRALNNCLKYTVKDPQGNGEETVWIDVEQLPPDGQRLYQAILDSIEDTIEPGITVMPIDTIKRGIEQAGFKIGEITGRNYFLEYNEDGIPILRKKEKTPRSKIVAEFNGGQFDAMIANSSGFEGISLHASERFRDKWSWEDVSELREAIARGMISVQLPPDINQTMQAMGRINRTGQIHLPYYQMIVSDLPSERRPLMVLARKLASLSANVSADQDTWIDLNVTDVINRYGDEAFASLLLDDDELNRFLGDPLDINTLTQNNQGRRPDASSFRRDGEVIKKHSGRLALQPTEIQEMVWAEVERRYADIVENAKQIGEYDLDSTDLDLQAQTISTTPLASASGAESHSSLGKPTVMEKVSVRRLKKPLRAEEIKERIDSKLEKYKDSESPGRAYVDAIVDKIERKFAEWAGPRYEPQDNETAEQRQRREQGEALANAAKNTTIRRYRNLEIGASYDIAMSGLLVHGILLDVRFTDKAGRSNPGSPGQHKAIFAVNSSQQIVTMQFNLTNDTWNWQRAEDNYLEKWDQELPTESREVRYIVTGNLLQTPTSLPKGQMTFFTRADGTIDGGILMPLSYRPGAAGTGGIPINRSQVDHALSRGVTLRAPEHGITLGRARGGGYVLLVPAARAEGGQFFLDEELNRLANRNRFEQYNRGSQRQMAAAFDQSVITQVLDRLEQLNVNFMLDYETYRYLFDQPVLEPLFHGVENELITRAVGRDGQLLYLDQHAWIKPIMSDTSSRADSYLFKISLDSPAVQYVNRLRQELGIYFENKVFAGEDFYVGRVPSATFPLLVNTLNQYGARLHLEKSVLDEMRQESQYRPVTKEQAWTVLGKGGHSIVDASNRMRFNRAGHNPPYTWFLVVPFKSESGGTWFNDPELNRLTKFKRNDATDDKNAKMVARVSDDAAEAVFNRLYELNGSQPFFVEKRSFDQVFGDGSSGGPRMRVGEAPRGTGRVTEKDVLRVFGKGAQLIEANETGIHVRTAAGKDIVVFHDGTWELTAEEIRDIERAYGRPLEAGEGVMGSFEVISGAGVIKLAKMDYGTAKEILRHESFHAATRFVLTAAEQRAILRQFGTWEDAAVAFETWKPAEQAPPHTLFQKILAFFKNLYLKYRPSAESVFAKVYSGEVWTRSDNNIGQLADANDIAAGIGAKRKVEARVDDRALVNNYAQANVAPEKASPKGIKAKAAEAKGWFGEQVAKFYTQVVSGQAPIEQLGEKAAKSPIPGVVMPAGQRPDLVMSQFRGRNSWAGQALVGDGVFHDEVDNFVTKDVLDLRAKAEQEFFDKGHVSPFTAEKLAKAQSKTYFTGEMTKVGDSLQTILTDESLVQAAEGLGISLEQVHKDLFQVKMVAERNMELGGYFGNRLPGDIKGVDAIEAKETLEALRRLYGTHYAALEKATDMVRDWMDKALLRPLVTVGRLSQEVYDQIKERNMYYVPFFRIMDEMATNGFVANNTKLFEVRNIPVKTIKGSERQIIDPLEMIIHLAYNVHDVYTRSKVARSILDLPQFADVGDEIKVVKAKYFQTPTMFKKEIDPVLFQQLEDLIESLGAKLRLKTKMRVQREFGKVTKEVRQEFAGGYIMEDEVQYIDMLIGGSEKSLTHLLGHMIFEKFPGLEKAFHLDQILPPGKEDVLRKELRAIADQRLMGTESQGFKRFVRTKQEQAAEFINRYVNANETARALAPNVTKAFEDFIKQNPELEPLLAMRPSHKIGVMEFEDKAWVKSQFAPKPNTMMIYDNGSPYWVEMPADLYQACVGMTQGEVSILQRVLAWPANLLRAGAILNPEFMARNFPRDIIQAMLMSRTGFNVKDWAFTAVGRLFGNDPQIKEWWAEWEAGGGPFATFAHSMTDHVRLTAEEISGEKKSKARILFRGGPVEALRDVSGFVENITRFAIYKQARERGLSHAEAIHASRTTTLDFNRSGGHPFIRALNMIIPFFNPAIQGLDKIATELRGPNRKAVLRRLGMMMAGSIMLWFLFHDDDRIKEMEPWEKNYFWHIPLGSDGPIVRIPKPFELGLMFASTPERVLDWMVDNDKGGVKAVAKSLAEAVLPPLLPTAMRPFIELQSNWNFFLGRPIEDISLSSLPPELRAKPWTKETSKALSGLIGKATGGATISPIQFEHFVMTLGGGLAANYLLPGVDVILRKTGVLNDIPQPTQDTLQQLWGVRSYFSKAPTGYRARTVNDFFERYQDIVQADLGWKSLWNTGQMEKLDAFLADNPEAMMGRIARKQISLMGKVKAERNQIYNDPAMDSDTKRYRLDELDRKIVGIARMANDFFDGKVMGNLTMPERGKMDKPAYYKRLSEATTDAWDAYRKQYQNMSSLSPGERSDAISRVIKKAFTEYREVPENPVHDLLKPFRASTIYDRPTRQERLAAHDVFGPKIPRGIMPAFTGYRRKGEEEGD